MIMRMPPGSAKAEWMKTARNAIARRLNGRSLQNMGDGIRSKLPALSQSVDLVSDAIASAGAGGGLLKKSFLAVVILPSVVYLLYASLWQSERYVAEARLTVREAQKQEAGSGVDAASIVAKLTGGGGGGSKDVQSSYIVLNYIKSRAILLDLGGKPYLERNFSRPDVDYFSRLSQDENLEDLWKYWLSHIYASVDSLSGILTVRIDAFKPEDAFGVTRDVVKLSEELINRISLRNRNDALSRAENEVVLARQKLADAREKVLQFRNQNFLIDPGSRAVSLGEMIGKLTMERIDLVNALSTTSTSLSSDAPSQRIQKTRLAAIDQQLAEMKKKLTGSEAAGTVSAQISGYERLKLEEQFAERMYSISQTAYETARQDVERQQLYLVTVVAPTLPESATYPKIFGSSILVFSSLLIGWAIVSLVVASIHDQTI
jgi:capsular polysaccharide transport system permease protein